MVTLAIWGEVINLCGDLDPCGLWGDMVEVITCAAFGDCRLRGVSVVRGVTLPSPIDLRCRPYNTGHRVICRGMGNVRLALKFAQALPETTSVVAYAEFENVIEVDRGRNVIFDFGV